VTSAYCFGIVRVLFWYCCEAGGRADPECGGKRGDGVTQSERRPAIRSARLITFARLIVAAQTSLANIQVTAIALPHIGE
jgi:hypothetical protein